MKIKDIQYLIDNKLQPNVAEWTMDVEDVLLEMDMLSDDTKSLLKSMFCFKKCSSEVRLYKQDK